MEENKKKSNSFRHLSSNGIWQWLNIFLKLKFRQNCVCDMFEGGILNGGLPLDMRFSQVSSPTVFYTSIAV